MAPENWNEVACLDPFEWVSKKIINGCRVVWIDSARARELLNSSNKLKPSDFRDNSFLSIFNFSKINNRDREMEYQKHFIVR